jgi:hypothetical protein
MLAEGLRAYVIQNTACRRGKGGESSPRHIPPPWRRAQGARAETPNRASDKIGFLTSFGRRYLAWSA